MAIIIRAVLSGLLIILLTDMKLVFGRLCDCESIKDILTEEIFDLKLRNRELTARLERLESSTMKLFQGSPNTAHLESDQIQSLETRLSTLESNRFETVSKEASNSRTRHSQIEKAFRVEKTIRHHADMAMKANIHRLNHSLLNLNEQLLTILEPQIKNITDWLTEVERNLSESMDKLLLDLSRFEDDANTKKQADFSQSMDNLKKDNREIRDDLEALINITILHQEASCYPKCQNGGVCFRHNTCICKPFSSGPRCEHPDDSCDKEQFRCRESGECIPNVWLCDGDNDCSDGSDEPQSNCDQRRT